MNDLEFHCRRLLAGLLVVAGVRGGATVAHAEDPQWFKLHGAPEVSLGLEVESSTEQSRVNGINATYDHTFVAPVMGIASQGSIYHPNLLTFSEDVTLGWNSDSASSKGPDYNRNRNDDGLLARYLARVNLLPSKPLNASFFAAQDHTYRDYGTFGTYTVDSSRVGGNVQYDSSALSLNADFGQRHEETSGLTDNSQVFETYLNFVGINRRKFGQTTLTYRVDEFDTTQNSNPRLTSLNQSVGVSDSETFGSRRQFTSTTGLGYGLSEYGSQETETFSANENFNANLRPNLDGYANLNYSRNQLRPYTSDIVRGAMGVRHRLYESLVSNLDVHGSHQENSGLNTSYTSDRYGLGLYESYTKKVQSWGRLSAGLGGSVDHEEDHSNAGTVTTFNEPHQLYLPTSPGYQPVYLDHPRVEAGSIQVNAGADVLVEPADYEVVTSGELTEIKLVVPPSAHLQSLLQTNDNLAVTVTYRSESISDASFEQFTVSAQIRLDMFGKFGVYGRVNWVDNNAPVEVLSQTLTDLVAGADYYWRWIRAGAEIEDYESNFTKYQAARFYQNFSFQPTAVSTLNVNFNQRFYRFPDDRHQDLYQFLTRYNIQIMTALSWYLEGGATWQSNMGSEQFFGSARTGINWTRGKLSVRAGYEYNTQTTTSGQWTEDRDKHRVFLNLKRVF
jgi:hypothetical protein